MGVITNVLKVLNIRQDSETCRAVVEDDELCGESVYGRGCYDGCEVKYCRDHVPSEAIPWGGRWEPVEFYVPEDEVVIEVE